MRGSTSVSVLYVGATGPAGGSSGPATRAPARAAMTAVAANANTRRETEFAMVLSPDGWQRPKGRAVNEKRLSAKGARAEGL